MREILFRGKTLSGRWIYGDLTTDKEEANKAYIWYAIEEIPGWNGYVPSESFTEVIPETVCQYTGITDKNEKKIFEGDIIKIHQFLFDGSEYEKEITVSVEYINESACFGANLLEAKEIKQYMGYTDQDTEKVVIPLNDFYGLHEESFEVIGNIFDNPELIQN